MKTTDNEISEIINSPSTLPALHHWLLIVLLLVETLAESAVVALHPGLTAGSAERAAL